ncbi:MAG: DUF4093 domain-containing protein [Oscillospiraceae bacterium]|jgi:ribonuclease M5|nr:DUF4093 domain-containing protein [Oscillospiraceae bacterium]
MPEKLRIREAIVVEGRYDKNTLSQVVDAVILETCGFGIFSSEETVKLLKFYADRVGLIVLTDSDGAGFTIRNRIRGCIAADKLKHAYIPDVYGRERRKKTASKEGKLGVEGMDGEVLRQCLVRAGATVIGGEDTKRGGISRWDMYSLGLNGKPGSAAARAELCRRLGLPERLGADALLDALNTMGLTAADDIFDAYR